MASTRRNFLAKSIGFTGGALLPLASWSQNEIDLLTVLAGIAPGGISDTAARVIANDLQGYAAKGVVENHSGAAGQLVVTILKGKPADGKTCFITPASVLTLYPHTYETLPYDPFEDLAPISLAARFEFGFAVGSKVPESIKSLTEFMEWCKANPEDANFGSPAAGSIPEFVGTLAGRASGVDLNAVAYRGSKPAIVDMLGGRLSAVSGTLGSLLPYAKSGEVRMLATSGKERSRFTPDVPTYVELGFTDIHFDEWLGFFMLAETDSAQVQLLSQALQKTIALPGIVDKLNNVGIEATSSSPEELATLLKADYERWGAIAKENKFTS